MTRTTATSPIESTTANDTGSVRAASCSDDFRRLIPRDFAREHLVLSQGTADETECLAVASTTSPDVIFNIGVRLGRPTCPSVADPEMIARGIDEAYGNSHRSGGPPLRDDAGSDATLNGHDTGPGAIERLIAEADRDLLSTSGKSPVIRLVDAILFDALSRGASDVHIQPLPSDTLIRYRLDGVLHTVRELSLGITQAVISRVKVMGRMDLAERRLPQDGRASVTIGDRPIDLRISTLPTSHGERAVLRLLDNSNRPCDFESLGMPADLEASYLACATRASGIILVTGPTGSGKTTTLYATLRRIGSATRNIMTIEDPIEYELAALGTGEESGGSDRGAISQAQVNTKKGITFATGLRHLLRQDPDIVMVGEIRDSETARIAIQSSLTGHLVFSTLHTNDAASAITRLLDLGVEAYLVSASLSAVLAQRLVRTVHNTCHGAGCATCLGTGYRGRTGLFELIVVGEAMREQIAADASLATIRSMARAAGVRTLADEGRSLIDAQRTTREEVDRVISGVGA